VQFTEPRDGRIRAYFVYHYLLSQFINAVLPNNKTKEQNMFVFLLTSFTVVGASTVYSRNISWHSINISFCKITKNSYKCGSYVKENYNIFVKI
jgi:hypothetical protein